MNARSFVCYVALRVDWDSHKDEVDCHACTKGLMTGRMDFSPKLGSQDECN